MNSYPKAPKPRDHIGLTVMTFEKLHEISSMVQEDDDDNRTAVMPRSSATTNIPSVVKGIINIFCHLYVYVNGY